MGAICILLSAACVIFLVGLIVGRSSSSQSDGTEVARAPTEKPEIPIAVEPEDPKKDESLEVPSRWKQVSPRRMDEDGREDRRESAQDDGYRDVPAPAPADTPPKTPGPRADEKPDDKPDTPETDKKPETQPASSPGEDKAGSVSEPVTASSDGPTPTEQTTKPETEPSARETSADETSAGETVSVPEEETPAETDKPAAPKGNTYAIQVTSVDVARQPWAEMYAKDLAKRIEHKPELVLSNDGMRIQVIVGRTSDKKSAEAIQKELKKQDEFKDCWLRTFKAK